MPPIDIANARSPAPSITYHFSSFRVRDNAVISYRHQLMPLMRIFCHRCPRTASASEPPAPLSLPHIQWIFRRRHSLAQPARLVEGGVQRFAVPSLGARDRAGHDAPPLPRCEAGRREAAVCCRAAAASGQRDSMAGPVALLSSAIMPAPVWLQVGSIKQRAGSLFCVGRGAPEDSED